MTVECRIGEASVASRLGAKSLPRQHMLADQVAQTERITGVPIERAYVDRGYRSHDANKGRVSVSVPV
jgi:hypothetical protein